MRTKNSFKNILWSGFSYLIVLLTGIFTKKILVLTLGLEIVSLEGIFINIISALSIVELGLGKGMSYKFYEPMVANDWEKISSILWFFKKCYINISILMTVFGLIAAFLIPQFIKEDFSKIWLTLIFLFYVADTIASYLFAHKRTLMMADQVNYYINNFTSIFSQLTLFFFETAVLWFFKSFELYLICKILFRLLENFWVSTIFNKKYPNVNLKPSVFLNRTEKKDMYDNVKALLYHKISAFSLTSSASVAVLIFSNFRENGMYANYMFIAMALLMFTKEAFNGILASFGNLLHTESNNKVYRNFKILYFANFFLYSIITVFFFNLINPFMRIWISENSVCDNITVIAFSVYLYMYGMRQSVGIAKSAGGIAIQDKNLALCGTCFTIVSMFILGQFFGAKGVLFGSTLGLILFPCWVEPHFVYKILFKKKVWEFHVKYYLYAGITIFYVFFTNKLCNIIKFDSITKIFLNYGISFVFPFVMNVLLFKKSEEFIFAVNHLKNFFVALKKNRVKN